MDALSIKERRLTCYPHAKYSILIRAYAEIKEISDSEAGAHAIRVFIDGLPADEKERIMRVANNQDNKGSKNSY